MGWFDRRLAVALFGVALVGSACSSGASTAPTVASTPSAGVGGSPSGGQAPSASAAAASSTAVATGSAPASVTAPPASVVASSPPVQSAAPSASAPPSTAPSVAGSASAAPSASSIASPAVALAWSKLETGAGPASREDHTWTVDDSGGAAWLFGGRDGATVFNDLWRFDLEAATWERVRAANPPAARFGHTATLVPGVGVVVFGGQAGGGFFNDLWAYDPGANAWKELPAGGAVPEPRYGSCAGLAPDGRLWISHGFTDQGRFFDQRAYDFAAGAWSEVTRDDPAPVVRCLHDCVWTADGQFVLYGGQTNGLPALGDLWHRTASGGWQQEPEPPLAARQLYAVTVVAGRAWIFGGADVDHKSLSDLWTLDLASFAWARQDPAGSGPAARLSATLVTDTKHARLLLFGGKNSSTTFDDVWSLALPAV